MPLGRSSDQGRQSGFEWFSGCWVEGPVGFAELEVTAGTLGDMPLVSMDEPVVKPAKNNQVVQVGLSALAPGNDVVDLEPPGVVAPWMPALASVTMMDKTSQPSWNDSASTTDTDRHTAVGDHRFDNTVTGQPFRRVIWNQIPTVQLGDPFSLGSQRFQLGEHHHLRPRRRGFVACGGERLHQGIGHTLRIWVEYSGFGVDGRPVSSRPQPRFDDFQLGVGQISDQPTSSFIQTTLNPQRSLGMSSPVVL